ncbi:hypothetical protein ENBRE01_3279, partial [Enteropsectra breve]
MKIIVRTPTSQRPVVFERIEELDEKLKHIFSVEQYSLFSDSKRTQPVDPEMIKNNDILYMSHEAKELKVF